MDFEFTDEQRLIQKVAYEFAIKEFEPLSKEHDREEKYPEGLWKKACEAGIGGVIIPKEYGGPGLGFLELALVTEQLSRLDIGLGLAIQAGTFGSENIVFFGSREQKKK